MIEQHLQSSGTSKIDICILAMRCELRLPKIKQDLALLIEKFIDAYEQHTIAAHY